MQEIHLHDLIGLHDLPHTLKGSCFLFILSVVHRHLLNTEEAGNSFVCNHRTGGLWLSGSMAPDEEAYRKKDNDILCGFFSPLNLYISASRVSVQMPALPAFALSNTKQL